MPTLVISPEKSAGLRAHYEPSPVEPPTDSQPSLGPFRAGDPVCPSSKATSVEGPPFPQLPGRMSALLRRKDMPAPRQVELVRQVHLLDDLETCMTQAINQLVGTGCPR
jgi:hypothetical protein